MLFFLRLLRLVFPLLSLFALVMVSLRFLGPILHGSGGYQQQGPQNGERSHNGQSRQGQGPGQGGFSSSAGGSRDPYKVLGCQRSDSEADIRRSYRRLMSRYHPDRFIAMELDEEFIQLSSRKTQEIKEAFEQIARQKGFR